MKRWGRRPSSDYDLMPGKNRYGVTDLRFDLQADGLPEPIVKWGEIYRGAFITGGTHHFYTDDYKFSALWSEPSPLGTSKCAVAVEPNYSIGPQTPRWQAIEKVAMKRWLARYWQEEFGVRIVVDLNVHPDHWDVAMLGVPQGWRSYATRVHADEEDAWERVEGTFDLACERAGTDRILFVVFGGSLAVRNRCWANGWLWWRCNRNWRDPTGTLVPLEHERLIHRMPPRLARDLLPEVPYHGKLKKKRRDTEPAEAADDE